MGWDGLSLVGTGGAATGCLLGGNCGAAWDGDGLVGGTLENDEGLGVMGPIGSVFGPGKLRSAICVININERKVVYKYQVESACIDALYSVQFNITIAVIIHFFFFHLYLCDTFPGDNRYVTSCSLRGHAGMLEMEWLILTGLLQKQIEQPG